MMARSEEAGGLTVAGDSCVLGERRAWLLHWLLQLARYLTAYRLAAIGVLLVAAGLRLIALDSVTLSGSEAGAAVAAYHQARGEAVIWYLGPSVTSALALVFFVFGSNDVLARLLPALSGVVLVALPLFWRRRIGRGVALAVSMMLALSPSLVFASRTLSSDMIGLSLSGLAFSLLALAWSRGKAVDASWLERHAWFFSAACAGLAYASGPAAGTILLVTIIALLVSGLRVRRLGKTTAATGLVVSRYLGVAMLTVVMISTSFGALPAGLQAGLVEPLTNWRSGGGVVTGYFLTAPLFFETLPVWLTLGSLLVGSLRPFAWRSLFTAVMLAGLFESVHMARAEALAYVSLPLLLAGGRAMAVAAERVSVGSWRRTLLVVLTLTPALGLFYVVAGYVSLPTSTLSPVFLLAPFFYLAVVIFGFWYLGLRELAPSLVVVALVAGLMFNVHFATDSDRLADHAGLARFQASQTAALLAEVERHASLYATPGRRDLPISVAPELGESLIWYLHRYTSLAVGPGRPEDRIVIACGECAAPGSHYAAREYTLLRREQMSADVGLRDWWRWWLYDEHNGGAAVMKAKLYVSTTSR